MRANIPNGSAFDDHETKIFESSDSSRRMVRFMVGFILSRLNFRRRFRLVFATRHPAYNRTFTFVHLFRVFAYMPPELFQLLSVVWSQRQPCSFGNLLVFGS